MGQAGIWERIRESSTNVALAKLGYDMLLKRQRRYRVAIDMGQWLVHSGWGVGFANPEVRTIYYRLVTLLDAGIAPLIVFDGKHRPKFKRDKNISTRTHPMQNRLIELAQALGIEYRIAPGEAEAEAALLCKEGIVDAVISDDFDALMFGSPVLLRNWSKQLSGSKAEEKDRKATHVPVYDLREIARHAPEMTPDGMAFLAILSGADYGHGIKGLGVELVSGLLRAGFHEPLLTAIREYSGARQEEALRCWREAIRLELRTNASGKLKSRRPAAAADFPSDFPDLATANAYLNPATSYTTAHFAELSHDFKGRIDVPALVAFFTEKFDWNHAEILDKVKNGLRRSLIMREFSDLIEGGMRENDVSSAPFFVEVPRRTTAQRTSKDTDETPETRLQLAHEKPWPFLKQAERALVHPDPNIGKADEWRAKDAARNGIELPQTTGDYVSKHKDDGRIWISTDLLKLSATGRRLIAEREQSKASPKKRAPLKNSSSLASASSVSPVKSRAGKMPSSSQASIVTISSEMNEDEGMAERSFQASRRRSITPKASSSTLSSNTSSQSTIRSKASTSYTTVLSDDELPSLDHHACVHKSGVAPKSPRKSKKHVSAHAVIDLISDSEDDSMPLRASPGKRARSAEAKLAQPILPFVATRGGKGKVKARATSPKDLLGATRTSPTMMGGSSHGCKRPSVVIDLD